MQQSIEDENSSWTFLFLELNYGVYLLHKRRVYLNPSFEIINVSKHLIWNSILAFQLPDSNSRISNKIQVTKHNLKSFDAENRCLFK